MLPVWASSGTPVVRRSGIHLLPIQSQRQKFPPALAALGTRAITLHSSPASGLQITLSSLFLPLGGSPVNLQRHYLIVNQK